MSFSPTPEQQAIIAAVQEDQRNLLISALAGAAKTSTLVLIAEAVAPLPTLAISFNKRIAEEMKKRLPDNCTSLTLNSLGHRVWSDAISKRLIVDTSKNFNILKELIETGNYDKDTKSEIYDSFGDILKTIAHGKVCGWLPEGKFAHAKPLLDDADFEASLDEKWPDEILDLIWRASERSARMAFQGTIDYDDQILMPALFPQAVFPRYPLVLVDEAQDLSPVNHRMLQKLTRGKTRIIAVGDECQAIYAFRGADEFSMKTLEEQFSMRKLILSVSFRCPIAVVEAARWRAPHMQYPEWAKPGRVTHLNTWSVFDIPAEATIICRNNAPLFSMAIKLLKNKRYAQLVGNDVTKNLIKTMKSFGRGDLPIDAARRELIAWRDKKLDKSRQPARVHDVVACIELFFNEARTLGEAMAYAEHIMNATGTITLMTGHKSKGLEFDHVFFLDEDLVKDEPQDKNLRYVIITRAKEDLTYIYTNGFLDTAEEGV